MINFLWDSKFKRNYKKLIKSNPEYKSLIKEKFTIFSENPFHTKLRTHKLKGKLQEYHSFSITHDIRIVFRFKNESEVLLVDIGDHDSVY